MDIKLNNGNLEFSGGDFKLTATYEDSVAQRLFIRFKTHLGKWFLNIDYGVDYFGSVFGKNVSKNKVDMLVRDQISKEPKVERITTFQSTIDRNTRRYICNFTVKIVALDQEQTYQIITTQNGLSLLTQDEKLITA